MKNGDKFARKGLFDLAPYVPGKPLEEVQKEYGLTKIAKLASNENPLGISPKAIAAMEAEIKNCFMYPESTSFDLRQDLAAKLAIDPDQIFITCGGDNVITLIGSAFINEGDEVIIGTPSFYTYTLTTNIMGGTVVNVPLTDLTFDLDAILAAITPKTKLIFFCNPNNPTGTIVPKEKVADFMSKVPEHCIVVFDEAYFEFAQCPEYGDGVEDYVKKEANVIVLRTFSKVYGLAGVRVGYAVCAKHLCNAFTHILPPFPLSRLGQAGAVGALSDEKFLKDTIDNNNIGRDYLYQNFDRLGLKYAPSYSNFIFVDIGVDAKAAAEEFLKQGVIIRPGQGWGTPTHIRVSIGLPDENEQFIKALEMIIG